MKQKLVSRKQMVTLIREDLKKKKTEKSDIVQKGRVGWTPKPYFRKE